MPVTPEGCRPLSVFIICKKFFRLSIAFEDKFAYNKINLKMEDNTLKNTVYNIQIGKVEIPTAPSGQIVSIEQLQVIATFVQILNDNGYTISNAVLSALARLEINTLKAVTEDIINSLKSLALGKTFKCMYEGFPQSVMDANEASLWFGALIHYCSNGVIRLVLDGDKAERPALETKHYRVLGLMKPQDKNVQLHNFVYSEMVWTPDQKEWILENLSAEMLSRMLDKEPKIPNHTNSSVLAGKFLYKNVAKRLVRTQTDVLRLAAYLYLDDPMLEKKEASKGVPRSARKRLMELLEGVMHSSEDMRRYEGYWKRFSSAIHPAEYPQYDHALQAFKQLWGGNLDKSYYSRLEKAITNKSIGDTLSLLSVRPGEFARSLSRILHMWPDDSQRILYSFFEIISEVDVPKLISILEYMMNEKLPYRVFTPRGGRAPYCISDVVVPLPESVSKTLSVGITAELMKRFGKLSPLGRVYIDPALKGLCIPRGQTTTSGSLKSVARGSRLKIKTDTNVIRGFVFWKNAEVHGQQIRTDIDLSAVMYDENWFMVEHIAYTNLRCDYACHSGDIVDAPDGAAEYIDIDLSRISKSVRYILFTANVFAGPAFANIEPCSAGWMERENLNSGEIWEPSTVENQYSIKANTRAVSMYAVDVDTREIIWIDRQSSSEYSGPVNSVITRQVAQMTAIRAEIEKEHFSLYNLFLLHAQARGELVDEVEDADFKIMQGGDVDPYDLVAITGEWL